MGALFYLILPCLIVHLALSNTKAFVCHHSPSHQVKLLMVCHRNSLAPLYLTRISCTPEASAVLDAIPYWTVLLFPNCISVIANWCELFQIATSHWELFFEQYLIYRTTVITSHLQSCLVIQVSCLLFIVNGNNIQELIKIIEKSFTCLQSLIRLVLQHWMTRKLAIAQSS